MRIELLSIPGIPIVQPGDDLPGILFAAVRRAGLHFQDRDVLVVAQKVVSKAEGRLVYLPDVVPSPRAWSWPGRRIKTPAWSRWF